MTDALVIWTIYAGPTDYPDQFVARKFLVRKTQTTGSTAQMIFTNDMFVADSIEEVRALLPPGLTCLARTPADDACIVESWL